MRLCGQINRVRPWENQLLLKLGFLLIPLRPSTRFASGDSNPTSLCSTETIIITYEWGRYYIRDGLLNC